MLRSLPIEPKKRNIGINRGYVNSIMDSLRLILEMTKVIVSFEKLGEKIRENISFWRITIVRLEAIELRSVKEEKKFFKSMEKEVLKCGKVWRGVYSCFCISTCFPLECDMRGIRESGSWRTFGLHVFRTINAWKHPVIYWYSRSSSLTFEFLHFSVIVFPFFFSLHPKKICISFSFERISI